MRRRTAAVLLLSAFALSCDGSPTPGPAAGASAEAAAERGLSPDWMLLSVPPAGGTASLHSPFDPGDEVWSGTASLPSVEAAVPVASRVVALRGPGGGIHRYDPVEDVVSRLGDLGGEARWSGGEDGGVWVRREDGGATLLTVWPDGTVRRRVERPVRWAAPGVDGSTVALLGSDPATLVRWPRGGTEPDATLELLAGPPAAVTARGRKAAVTRTDAGGEAMQVVSLERMEPGERVDLDGPVTAVAASPSSHQLYVAVDDPPRLVVFGRISGELRTRARFEEPIRAIRPGLAGGPPVVWDGQAAYLVPWGGGEPVRLESRWRGDLPLALSDGSVLVAREGTVRRRLAGAGSRTSPGSADRLWVPVRWRAEARGPSPEEEGSAALAGGGAALGDTASPGAPADGLPREPEGAADSLLPDSVRLDTSLRVDDPGFYVVLGWSRSPGGVEERLRPVREGGFPVAAQLRRDDAGARWYRGLVGPYAERSRAEEVARLLRREHSVDGWVQEVRPGLLPDEVFR